MQLDRTILAAKIKKLSGKWPVIPLVGETSGLSQLN